MSDKVQLHPMKKLIYETNHFYHLIRKDIIMSAIRWLQQNNPLYKNISLNNEWEVSWENSKFSPFLTINNEISNMEKYCKGDESHVLDTNDVGGISSESCMVENMDDSNNILQTQEDDLELVQDQEALDCKLQLTGLPLPNVVELEDIEASIYSCAPG